MLGSVEKLYVFLHMIDYRRHPCVFCNSQHLFSVEAEEAWPLRLSRNERHNPLTSIVSCPLPASNGGGGGETVAYQRSDNGWKGGELDPKMSLLFPCSIAKH